MISKTLKNNENSYEDFITIFNSEINYLKPKEALE